MPYLPSSTFQTFHAFSVPRSWATLQTLLPLIKYDRFSHLPEITKGSIALFAPTALLKYVDDYWVEGYHDGPLCKLCESKNQYFDDSDGKCVDCSHSSLLALRVSVVV